MRTIHSSTRDGEASCSEGPEPELALAGRTIQVVSDVSLEEQLYLFERARRLKASREGEGAGAGSGQAPPLCQVLDAGVSEKVDGPDSTVYLVFMEGSTRTRESLRNAAVYHGVKVNEFQAETSSFRKNETITDTMKMLSLYSTQRSVFVIRSPMEGVCRWLQTVLPAHAEKFGIPRPAFVNAGDGRHTHPVGELVDQFSLLEQCRWDRSSLHIALVGDLSHGRTAHSKALGLKVFKKVRVDLIAPEPLAYPVEYRNKMRANGFEIREFGSVEDYLHNAKGTVAPIWYFYRPQFKRCGDLPQSSIDDLRTKVSFRIDWEASLPAGARFFQTLPRDKEHPLIPLAFDAMPLNGWDRHTSNAYYANIVLLGMLFGKIGRGIPSVGPPEEAESHQQAVQPSTNMDKVDSSSDLCPLMRIRNGAHLPAFIQRVDLTSKERHRRPERARAGGAVPLADGLVVDHIGLSSVSASCWRRLQVVRNVMGWSAHIGSEGVYESTSHRSQNLMKAIVSLPNFDFDALTVPQMKVLASVAPGCTVNAVAGSTVVGKYRLHVPVRIYNLPNIRCCNTLCISNPQNRQRDVFAFFERVPFYETSALLDCHAAEYLFVCKYCLWPHQYEDIWADANGNTP